MKNSSEKFRPSRSLYFSARNQSINHVYLNSFSRKECAYKKKKKKINMGNKGLSDARGESLALDGPFIGERDTFLFLLGEAIIINGGGMRDVALVDLAFPSLFLSAATRLNNACNGGR